MGYIRTPEMRAATSERLMRHSVSKEARAKMRLAHQGVPLSADHRAAVSLAVSGEGNPFFGKQHSDETKARISAAKLGQSAGELHPMFGKVHTVETREKMRAAHRRRGHTGVRGSSIRSTGAYRRWRRSVLERDKHTCQWCGSTNKVEADHIKPFALFPHLALDIENGRTLCKPCHLATDTYGGRSHGR